MNTEHEFADTNRHLVEVPDTFAIARWPRDADVATIARCILGTLKYEPHAADTAALRRALEERDRSRTARILNRSMTMERTVAASVSPAVTDRASQIRMPNRRPSPVAPRAGPHAKPVEQFQERLLFLTWHPLQRRLASRRIGIAWKAETTPSPRESQNDARITPTTAHEGRP